MRGSSFKEYDNQAWCRAKTDFRRIPYSTKIGFSSVHHGYCQTLKFGFFQSPNRLSNTWHPLSLIQFTSYTNQTLIDSQSWVASVYKSFGCTDWYKRQFVILICQVKLAEIMIKLVGRVQPNLRRGVLASLIHLVRPHIAFEIPFTLFGH